MITYVTIRNYNFAYYLEVVILVFKLQDTRPCNTPPPPHDQVLCMSAASMKRTLNTRKATGPDNIPGRVLKDCAEELKDVFTDVFNTSLRQAAVPSCFKATAINLCKRNPHRPASLTIVQWHLPP